MPINKLRPSRRAQVAMIGNVATSTSHSDDSSYVSSQPAQAAESEAWQMKDHEVTERPGKGWTPWKGGAGLAQIEAVWWDARVLRFAKLNCSGAFSGSDLVGIEHWGFRRDRRTRPCRQAQRHAPRSFPARS